MTKEYKYYMTDEQDATVRSIDGQSGFPIYFSNETAVMLYELEEGGIVLYTVFPDGSYTKSSRNFASGDWVNETISVGGE